MHILDEHGERIELEPLSEPSMEELARERAAPRGELDPAVRASRAVFEIGLRRGPAGSREVPKGPPPAVFRETDTGLLRTTWRELMIRFRAGTPERTRRAIARRHGLEERRKSEFVEDQAVFAPRARTRGGAELLDLANDCAELEDVVFATPNFVSEYRRDADPPSPRAEQWHLRNRGRITGQKRGEDVDAIAAWRLTTGKRGIVVAVIDDGVDIEHPNLRARIWRNPRTQARDRHGRDFFLRNDQPGHFNPRPKVFAPPYSQLEGNDIHGTPCAGVVAAAGRGAHGVAFRCRILPVKIFHADFLAEDERVADSIRYATRRADVLSCSWSGGRNPDLALALEDAGGGRDGRGAAVLCASGNGGGAPVAFPARSAHAIAVGASTDQARLASYSNVGPRLDLVAPSNGGRAGIYTTDVSYPGRGFNLGHAQAGGRDGLHTNSFGGTSSATPLAAGVAALALSLDPKLSRDELHVMLRETADKIGRGYDTRGHSDRFGYGRVNAAKAAEAAKASAAARP